MKKFWKIGLVFFLITGMLSCNTLIKKTEVSLYERANEQFDQDLYRLYLKFRCQSNASEDNILQNVKNLDDLVLFYGNNDYDPVWTRNILNHTTIDTIAGYFKNAEIHGLSPEYYNVDLIELTLNNYINSIEKDTSIDYISLANLELLISDALISYRNHLECGYLNPKELDPQAYHLPLDIPDSNKYFAPLETRNIVNFLESLQPDDKNYKYLQAALMRYRSIESSGGWPTLDVTFQDKEKIEPGDTAYFLPDLATRLIITGELEPSYIPESIELDSLNYSRFIARDFTEPDNKESIHYFVYNEQLVNAVRRFQNHHGLFVDGVIGNLTINKLNIPVEEKISQIIVNLERLRWFNYPDEQYLLVNIPDYKLYIIEDGEEKLEMKVCVGRKRDYNYTNKLKLFRKTRNRRYYPNNNETPLLHGNISHFVLNPKWYVPDNIGKNELYWKALKDPNYLSQRNFKVFENGVEISTDSINWSDYSADALPFRFQQDASAGNALGKVKFIFKNDYNIYLHDTPSTRAFGYTNRAVSHGCIRLEKPLDLAEFIVQDIDNIDGDDLRVAVGMKPKNKDRKHEMLEEHNTQSIILQNQIPLFINYFTTWVDDNGIINFRDDVYEKDKMLLENMISI